MNWRGTKAWQTHLDGDHGDSSTRQAQHVVVVRLGTAS